MTKNEFLNILREGLKDFPEEELQDIIYDYEEYFYSAMEAGKTEEEALKELGDPYSIVNGYRSGYLQKVEPQNKEKIFEESKAEEKEEEKEEIKIEEKEKEKGNKILRLVLIGIGILIALPVIFGVGLGGVGLVFGAIGAIIGLIVTIIAVPFSLFIAGIAILFSVFFNQAIGFVNVPPFLADFPIEVVGIMTLGSFAFSLLSILISYYIVKSIIIGIKGIINLFRNRGNE